MESSSHVREEKRVSRYGEHAAIRGFGAYSVRSAAFPHSRDLRSSIRLATGVDLEGQAERISSAVGGLRSPWRNVQRVAASDHESRSGFRYTSEDEL